MTSNQIAVSHRRLCACVLFAFGALRNCKFSSFWFGVEQKKPQNNNSHKTIWNDVGWRRHQRETFSRFGLWIIQSHTTHFISYASSILDTRHSLIVLSYRRQIALCSNHLKYWNFCPRLRLCHHFRLKPWDYGRRRRLQQQPNSLKSIQMFYNIQFGNFSQSFTIVCFHSAFGFCHSFDADFTLICAQYAFDLHKFLISAENLIWLSNLKCFIHLGVSFSI